MGVPFSVCCSPHHDLKSHASHSVGKAGVVLRSRPLQVVAAPPTCQVAAKSSNSSKIASQTTKVMVDHEASAPLPSAIPPMSPVAGESVAAVGEVCFICLEPHSHRHPLSQPCACPRAVHPLCMARWQLQQAGRTEETLCRFCHQQLPDWKHTLMPQNKQLAEPIMLIRHANKVHRIVAEPGPEGKAKFQRQVRELFGFPQDMPFEVAFSCKDAFDSDLPVNGVKLDGMSCYDAATHCASYIAANRRAALANAAGVTGTPAVMTSVASSSRT